MRDLDLGFLLLLLKHNYCSYCIHNAMYECLKEVYLPSRCSQTTRAVETDNGLADQDGKEVAAATTSLQLTCSLLDLNEESLHGDPWMDTRGWPLAVPNLSALFVCVQK